MIKRTKIAPYNLVFSLTEDGFDTLLHYFDIGPEAYKDSSRTILVDERGKLKELFADKGIVLTYRFLDNNRFMFLIAPDETGKIKEYKDVFFDDEYENFAEDGQFPDVSESNIARKLKEWEISGPFHESSSLEIRRVDLNWRLDNVPPKTEFFLERIWFGANMQHRLRVESQSPLVENENVANILGIILSENQITVERKALSAGFLQLGE